MTGSERLEVCRQCGRVAPCECPPTWPRDAMTDTRLERMAAFVATLNLPEDLVPALLQFRCGCAAQCDPAGDRWYGSPCAKHTIQTITRQVVAPNGGGVIIHGK